MKKGIASVGLVACCVMGFSSLTSCGVTLNFYNWGEYIDLDTISAFETENNCTVKMSTFQDNEFMLSKMESTSYDVVIPSDYAIEELASNDKLLELDYSKFSNYSKDSLVPSFKADLDELAKDVGTKKGFDLLKYAVPYTWGEVGMIYDSSKISEEEIKEEGWNALKTVKNKDGSNRQVCLYNESRDVYSMALAANGYDFVSPTEAQIATATDWLTDLKSTMGENVKVLTDEILTEMPKHSFDVCFDFSGDASFCIMNEVDPKSPLRFYIPDAKNATAARTNIYTDAMVITKDCANPDLAYKFVDFMCQKEMAKKNTEYIGYTSPLSEVYNEEIAADGAFNDVESYAIKANAQDHFYRYDETLKSKFEEAWNNIKLS